MREFKFRAKKETITEANKSYCPDGWVYGDTLYQDDDGVYILPHGVSAESYHLSNYNFRANSDTFQIMVAKVNRETVGQYTGLCDKNGTKIFEGDIVKSNKGGTLGIVEWFDELVWDGWGSNHSGFYCKQWLMHGDELSWHLGFDCCEVIGNRYDNPEFLEVNL